MKFFKYCTRYTGAIVAGLLLIGIAFSFGSWFSYTVDFFGYPDLSGALFTGNGFQCAYGYTQVFDLGEGFEPFSVDWLYRNSVLVGMNVTIYLSIILAIVFMIVWIFRPERINKLLIKVFFAFLGLLIIGCGVVAFCVVPIVVSADPSLAAITTDTFAAYPTIEWGAIVTGIFYILAGLACYLPLFKGDEEFA